MSNCSHKQKIALLNRSDDLCRCRIIHEKRGASTCNSSLQSLAVDNFTNLVKSSRQKKPAEHHIPKMIPKTSHPFKISRIALAIMVASAILAILLAIVTLRNLNREQRLMEKFLLKEGLTIIRTFEAGARTSMMMRWQGDRSLKTLVQETAKENTVAYIRIIDEQGREIAAAGNLRLYNAEYEAARVLAADGPLTSLSRNGQQQPVFEVAREFKPEASGGPGWERMYGRWQQWCAGNFSAATEDCRQVIYVGLNTTEFDEARQKDVQQSLLMGGILLLLGSAGFYFLFLYQGMWVSRSTLENMELYTRNVIDSMPSGLVTIDVDGRIVSSNARAEELFGKSFAELEGKTLQEATGGDQKRLAEKIRKGEDFFDMPTDCVQPDGQSIPVKVSASPLLNRDGGRLGTVLALRDMREIRAMEEQLERSRRLAALGRMAAAIAHEIRNPLGTLRGFAQYFGQKAHDNKANRECADLMVDEVDRLNRTVSGLLQFARPREPDRQRLGLAELLKKTARLMEDDFAGRQVHFEFEPPVPEISIIADPDLMVQVLINLLLNALHATDQEDTVTLAAWKEPDGVAISVQDTGKGMTEEMRARMFDPFFTTKKSGSGLGLAVVHQIIEQHHGSIKVGSTVGRGTNIIILLPDKGDGNEREKNNPAG